MAACIESTGSDGAVTERSKFERALWTATLAVATLGLSVELFFYGPWPEIPRRLLDFLSLSMESNLPTWWASILAAVAAWHLRCVASASDSESPSDRWRWWLLAAGFAFISLDEVAQLHEDVGLLVEGEGWLYFGWVKPAAGLIALLGVVYLPFLRALPPAIRWRFILAGGLYVGGALLLELPLGAWTEAHGTDNVGYSLIDWVEETLELVGLTYFVLVLRQNEPHLAKLAP